MEEKVAKEIIEGIVKQAGKDVKMITFEEIQERLNKIVSKYENYRQGILDNCEKLRTGGVYTAEYINRNFERASVEVKDMLEKVAVELSTEAARIKGCFLRDYSVKPEDYSLNLNTIVSVLCNLNEDVEADAIRVLIEPYKRDYTSILVFKNIVKNNFYNTLKFYVEDYDKIVKQLDRLIYDPVHFLSRADLTTDEKSLFVSGKIDAVDNGTVNYNYFLEKLSDNMTCLEQRIIDNWGSLDYRL